MNLSNLTLAAMMQEKLAEGGYMVAGGRASFMEVLDTSNGEVWMSAAPVEATDCEQLSVESPLIKMGVGAAAMDSALFQYSPALPAKPVRQRVIGDRLFIHVATPLERKEPTQVGGAFEASVDKSHVIGFEAGRTVVILVLPEGNFVEVVGDDGADASLVLPEGSVLKALRLQQPWVVELPTPTRAMFWPGGSLRSFQGPIALPQHSESLN